MTINITVTDETVQPEIYLGRQGEKNYREIVFDLSALKTKYGAGTATLCHQRSQDLAPYVVEESTGNTLTWVVSDTDTAFPGIGYAEFRYTFGNDNLSKSTIFATNVKESLNDDIVVPEPLQSYFDKMMEYISSHGNAGAGLTGDVISALLDCFAHVAWIDDDGQDYYDALEDALQDIYWDVTNTLSHCVSSNSATSIVKGTQYLATITASAGYTLDGATVSIVMGSTDITSSVYNNGIINIPAVNDDLAISITAAEIPVQLVSIDATYTQGGTVYDTASLDDLKSDLVVVATFDDTSTATVSADDYTLSGSLTAGTSTITATYEGKTDTFTVTVTHYIAGWYYKFDGNLTASGAKDFGLTGTANYDTGYDGQAFYREGTSSTDPLGLKATGLTDYPVWGKSDFTIAYWHKTKTAKIGHPLALTKYGGSATGKTWNDATVNTVASGWTVDVAAGGSASYAGIRIGYSSGIMYLSVWKSDLNNAKVVRATMPQDFDTTQWHHIALTRSGANLYYFVDGELIYTVNIGANSQLYSANQVAVGSWFNTTSGDDTNMSASGGSEYVDDLYINVGTCKWTSDFDPSAIVY